MVYREYDAARDKEAARRVWREVGWLEPGKEDVAEAFLAGRRAFVAEIKGEAECVVTSASGVIRYLDEDLPFVGCTGVATSRVARRQGLARRLLARVLAADVADGAAVAGINVFEQGFYDQLGYGMGGYEHDFSFDPGALNVSLRPRVPRRLTRRDTELMHASRLARRRGHGGVNFHHPSATGLECLWAEKDFGLGYCDGDQGELTHHFWCNPRKAESGPYHLHWITYQTADQFLELMALLKSLGDQVALVSMREPPGIQLQDLIDRPLKLRRVTDKSSFENRARSEAYWQMRICDLRKCLEQTHLRGGETRFNLKLTDPIENLLDAEAAWRGVAGDYVVALGASSGAEPGRDASLSTLIATVNAFTRLWLGVRPATGLAVTDELSGPPSLLEELDWRLRLPDPKPDWEY